MRVVIQRVSSASVTIDDKIRSAIKNGLMILLGIEAADDQTDIAWLVKKIVNLRVFNDDEKRMNLSIKDIDGDILLISQFTLHASVKKGNRPSYIKSAHPDLAIPLYNKFIDELELSLSKKIYSGEFGAMMEVALVNDGPVTIIIDTKTKE